MSLSTLLSRTPASSAHVKSSSRARVLRGRASRIPFCARAVQSPEAAVTAHPAQQSYDKVWSAFASKAQGEWEGITVTFEASGAAQPLPDRYVPGAYRDWGVELFDWQSQSSCTIPQGRSLRNIFKRLMPTVGCEADAIAFVEEAADVWQADGGSAVKPVTPDGGYLAAPAQLPAGGGKVKLEGCVAAPGGKSRLRAVLTLMQHWESKQWQVAFVDLSRETWYGEFNGGVELSGCAGGGRPFAKDAATAPEVLAGAWRAEAAESYTYAASADGQLELVSGVLPVASATGQPQLLLPLGVWVRCSAAGGDVELELGALRGVAVVSGEAQAAAAAAAGVRDVVRASYKAGKLHRAELVVEARA
ncbi:hypothetical protein HXX76_010067 [Chlamydomonas incerta]|uniref:Uncharacterized protein n=1 Tax=Chlamydomonas incerta TaxID=51695 RepID=A0A835SSE6_CHLIN|nr:hypothetical protein HXX76_010067 [Chlamydomonas incerta]|eukprot:KAG2430547.1 hypothetical protein HXX76_010067 [Chlamydomonas incerta]